LLPGSFYPFKNLAYLNFKTKHCFKIKEVEPLHFETTAMKYLGSQYYSSAETTG